MALDQERANNITQQGRHLLTLIRDAGREGILRKGLTDALHDQLSSEDEQQLQLLEAQGLITSESVDIINHPDVERLYRVAEGR